MSEFAQGLTISLVGMAITFGVLGLLILVIVLLRAIFAAPSSEARETIPTPARPVEPETDPTEAARREAVAVAVSVAYLQRKRERKSSLGALLERPPGPWWYVHAPGRED